MKVLIVLSFTVIAVVVAKSIPIRIPQFIPASTYNKYGPVKFDSTVSSDSPKYGTVPARPAAFTPSSYSYTNLQPTFKSALGIPFLTRSGLVVPASDAVNTRTAADATYSVAKTSGGTDVTARAAFENSIDRIAAVRTLAAYAAPTKVARTNTKPDPITISRTLNIAGVPEYTPAVARERALHFAAVEAIKLRDKLAADYVYK